MSNKNFEPYTDKRYAWKVEFLADAFGQLDMCRQEIVVIESSAMRALTHASRDILLPLHGSYLQILKIERVGEVAG